MASICPRCGTEIPADAPPSADGGICSSCGTPLGPPPPGVLSIATAPLRRYLADLFEITVHPVRFFRKMPASGGASGPLAFALITHWIGAALEFLWKNILGGTLTTYLAGLFQIAGDVADVDHPGRGVMLAQFRDKVVHWLWGAGSIVADPFLTLLSILFTSFFVFIGARLLVNPRRDTGAPDITFETALRVVCFGLTPSILAGLPLAGGAVSFLWVMVVTVVGAREVYRIDTGRAIVVGLFPKMLFLGMILSGLLLVAVVLLKLLTSVL